MCEKAGPVSSSVLIVEDNPASQQALTQALIDLGWTVELAAAGLEALEKIEKGSFALILMDLHLPGMDGMRAARLIRAREKVTGRRVPIIGVGLALPGDRQRCLEAGMDEYLPGPVSAPDLQTILQRVVGSPGPARAAETGAGPAWLQAIQRLGFGGPEVRDLVETFLETTPTRLSDLAHSVEQGDPGKTRLAAHALKGSLVVFEVEPLVQVAREMEEEARAGALGRSRAAFPQLDAGVRRFMGELRAYLNQQGM